MRINLEKQFPSNGLELNKPWGAEAFLIGAKPDLPIKLDATEVRTTDALAVIEAPSEIMTGKSETLSFEWHNGQKVR